MILFLDDAPERAALAYQRWPEEKRSNTIWCSTAEEAIGVLRDYVAVLTDAHLDHDLGTQDQDPRSETSGMEVVRFLEKQDASNYRKCKFIIHSWNIHCAHIMYERLTKAGYTAELRPFGM